MKILFVFALLTNIIIFLWEYNKGTEYVQLDREFSMDQPKQILLLAEVAAGKNNVSLDINLDRIYALSELMIPKNTFLLPTVMKNNHPVEKKPNLLTRKVSEVSLKKSEDIKNKVEIAQKVENIRTKSEKQNVNSLKAKDDKQQSIELMLVEKKSDSLTLKPSAASLKKTETVQKKVEIAQKVENIRTKSEKQNVNSLKAKDDKQQSIELMILGKKSDSLSLKPSAASLKKTETVQKKVEIDQKAEKIPAKNDKQGDDNLKARNDKQQKADVKVVENNKLGEINTKKICYQIGPFVTTRRVSRWGKRNKISKDSLHQISKDKAFNKRFLVYYPAAKTFSQSVKNVQMLKKKGISDYWLIRKGASKGAISLGFFVREMGAQELQRRLFEKGLKVYIKQKFDKKSVYFAQVSSSDEKFKKTLRIKKNQSISLCNDD